MSEKPISVVDVLEDIYEKYKITPRMITCTEEFYKSLDKSYIIERDGVHFSIQGNIAFIIVYDFSNWDEDSIQRGYYPIW